MTRWTIRRPRSLLGLVAAFSLALAACSPAAPAAAPTTAPAAQPTAAPKPAATAAATLASAAPTSAPTAAAAAPTAAAAAKPAATAASSTPAFNQADWDKVVAAAKQEGALVITTEPGTDYDKFIATAREKLPDIKIDHTGMRPSEFVTRALAEQKQGQYLWDVAIGPGSNILSVLNPANAVQDVTPFVQGLSPAVTDPSKWSGGFMQVPDPKQPTTFVFMNVAIGGIYVNRDKVPASELSTADQLLDSKFKGKISVYNPDQSTGGSQTLGALLVSKGPDYLTKLLDGPGITKVDSQRTNTEWLATGRYPIAMGVDRNILHEFQDQGIGKNVDRFDDGSVYLHSYGASVLKDAPHPNATKVFLNWFLSQEGQDTWASMVTDGNSRRLDVKVYNPETTPDYKNLGQYKYHLVSPEGTDVLKQVFAMVKGK